MLRSSDVSNTASFPLLCWCIAIAFVFLLVWITHRSSNTIVIYTPKMKPLEGPDIDSIRLDIQFRSPYSCQSLYKRQPVLNPILKSQSLPSMREGSKKTM